MATTAEENRWDNYFMRIAILAALRSKDPSTPVGAVIVNKDHKIVGIGYNSMPYIEDKDNDAIFPWKGDENYRTHQYDVETKYPFVVHGAVNAIANRSIPNLQGCTIYLTHKPDKDCADAIIISGITTVKYCMYTRRPDRENEPDMIEAEKALTRNKITMKYLSEPELQEKERSNEKITAVVEKLLQKIDERIERAKNEGATASGPYSDYIRWDEFFMDIARLSTTNPREEESKPELKVGACIVNENKQVVSVGFSGYPDSMCFNDTDGKEGQAKYMTHAEYQAILTKGTPLVRGCTLYVTKYPCNVCAKLIVQSGISKVVYDEDGTNNDNYNSSRKLLNTVLGSNAIWKYEY